MHNTSLWMCTLHVLVGAHIKVPPVRVCMWICTCYMPCCTCGCMYTVQSELWVCVHVGVYIVTGHAAAPHLQNNPSIPQPATPAARPAVSRQQFGGHTTLSRSQSAHCAGTAMFPGSTDAHLTNTCPTHNGFHPEHAHLTRQTANSHRTTNTWQSIDTPPYMALTYYSQIGSYKYTPHTQWIHPEHAHLTRQTANSH